MGIRIEAPWTPGCHRLRRFYLRKDQWDTIIEIANTQRVSKGVIVRKLIEKWWVYDVSKVVYAKSFRLCTFAVDPFIFQRIENTADAIQVGTQTLLRADGPRGLHLPRADKDVLELHHPGVHEVQGRIVRRDQRVARYDAVLALREVVEECLADVRGGRRLHDVLVYHVTDATNGPS